MDTAVFFYFFKELKMLNSKASMMK